MIKTVETRENYVLVREGDRYAVLERRAGKLYSVRPGRRDGASPEDGAALARVIGEQGWSDEIGARRMLVDLVTRRDELANRIW